MIWLIIGSGPGGYVAAIRASQWGLKTAVVEKESVSRRNLPARRLHSHKSFFCIMRTYMRVSKRAEDLVLKVKDVKVKLARNAVAQRQELSRSTPVVSGHCFKKNKVDSITGWGRIAGPGRVSVEKRRQDHRDRNHLYHAGHGSEARSLPQVEIDGKTILTNREILALPSISEVLVVVGCGAVRRRICLDFSHVWGRSHSLEALPRVVPLEDEEISAELLKSFTKRGIRVELEAKVDSVQKDAKGATVAYKDRSGKSQTIAAEKVLIAVGRRPLTENIGIEKTKSKVERGFVHTNAYLENR